MKKYYFKRGEEPFPSTVKYIGDGDPFPPGYGAAFINGEVLMPDEMSGDYGRGVACYPVPLNCILAWALEESEDGRRDLDNILVSLTRGAWRP